MNKVKCLIYSAPGKPEFANIEKENPESNHAGIIVLASSLCNTSELRSFRGGYEKGYGSGYPMKPGEPGHEAVGIVESIGSEVKEIKVGDMVAMTGHGGNPCHRSYVLRNANDIARLEPGNRNAEEAAMLEMYGCAYHCAVSPGGLEFYEGKRVLVMGLGSMGLCTIQILRGIGNIEITAADINEERLGIAGKSGAGILLLPDEVKGTFDIIIECSGSVSGQELSLGLAPKTLIFSSYNTRRISLKQNLLFDSNTTIYNPGIPTSENFKKAVGLYNEGKINPSLLVTGEISADIDEYLKAIEDIKNGKTIKTLMIW